MTAEAVPGASRAIVIDTSAIVAILFGEPEASALETALLRADERWVSAFTLLEVNVVIAAQRGEPGRHALDALLRAARVDVVPFTPEQAHVAVEAWVRFGKGRHPAALNLGDCVSYALSRHSGLPLLAKGGDFAQTDVERVPTS